MSALMLVSACTSKSTDEVTKEPQSESVEATESPDILLLDTATYRQAGIQTDTLARRPIGTGIKVNGVLDVPPEQLISINAPFGGIVEKTTLLQGQHVHKGEVLAVIRNPAFIQMQEDFVRMQGQLRYAKADLDRQRELVRDEVAPLKGLQRAEAEYATLEAQLEGQRARLKLAGLPAGAKPFATTARLLAQTDAYVKEVNVTVGQTVTPTDALFQLVDPSHLHVELTVFEKDAVALRHGQTIRFTLPNDSSAERRAHIYLISRSVDPAQRTVRVHGHLEDEDDPHILPGMYVRAVIETARRNVTALPTQAVVRYEGRTYAFLALPDSAGSQRLRLQPVTAGAQESGYTQVSFDTPLPPNPRFVTQGAYALLGKLKNVEEEE